MSEKIIKRTRPHDGIVEFFRAALPDEAGEPLTDTFRRLIRESGMSILAIARETGIGQPVLSRFMSEQQDMTLRTANKLKDFFGLELRPITRRKLTT
jgi:DNA-binding phage protein